MQRYAFIIVLSCWVEGNMYGRLASKSSCGRGGGQRGGKGTGARLGTLKLPEERKDMLKEMLTDSCVLISQK